MTPIHVLVTGATSPLGAALVGRLLASTDTGRVLAIGAGLRARAADDARLVSRDVSLDHARAVHDLLWGPARALAIDVVIHAAPATEHASSIARALVLGCADHPTIRRLVARSSAEVYATPRGTTSLLDEDAPLEFGADAERHVRELVQADTIAAVRRDGPLQISVLRCAELLAGDGGGQLRDYLSSRVCLRPLGFDPMINVLSLEDAVAAFVAAARADATGVFNIPGADTLPLSRAIAACGRADVPLPAALLAPLYAARRALTHFEFRYERHARRFHVGGILDGGRARRLLGYVPQTHVHWPRA